MAEKTNTQTMEEELVPIYVMGERFEVPASLKIGRAHV